MGCGGGTGSCGGAANENCATLAVGGRGCGCCSEAEAKRAECRLTNLAACEPFCSAPGCAAPQSQHCWFDKLARCGLKTGVTAGRRWVELPGGERLCLDPELGQVCDLYGPHGNAAVRDGDLSPADLRAISETYALESFSVTLTPHSTSPWYIGALGALGISHTFCLLDFEVVGTVSGGGTVALTPTGVAVAGSLLVCSEDSPGSYEWAVNKACHLQPGSDITEGRCRCVSPPCAPTPAGAVGGGHEWFLAELPDIQMAVSITLSGTLLRCGWLGRVAKNVCPRNNRTTYASLPAGTVFPVRRTVAGDIQVLP